MLQSAEPEDLRFSQEKKTFLRGCRKIEGGRERKISNSDGSTRN